MALFGLPLASLVAPRLAVGDRAFVLYCPDVSRPDALCHDLICGDTSVVRVARTGSVYLANGMRFDVRGRGLSGCRACVVSTVPSTRTRGPVRPFPAL